MWDHVGYFQSLGLVPETTTLITISLSWGVGIGVSMISTASIELCTIASLGIVVDFRSEVEAMKVDSPLVAPLLIGDKVVSNNGQHLDKYL
jgi:hypothetical protein